MIQFVQGNLFDAPVQALVNPVNTVGTMGKGLALEFKRRFPEIMGAYLDTRSSGALRIGTVLTVDRGTDASPRWIIHLPTKQHWRHPSKLEFVESGLHALVEALYTHQVQSVAVPALGCGLGGLDWLEVRPLIEAILVPLEGVNVWVFEP